MGRGGIGWICVSEGVGSMGPAGVPVLRASGDVAASVLAGKDSVRKERAMSSTMAAWGIYDTDALSSLRGTNPMSITYSPAPPIPSPWQLDTDSLNLLVQQRPRPFIIFSTESFFHRPLGVLSELSSFVAVTKIPLPPFRLPSTIHKQKPEANHLTHRPLRRPMSCAGVNGGIAELAWVAGMCVWILWGRSVCGWRGGGRRRGFVGGDGGRIVLVVPSSGGRSRQANY